MEVSDFLPKYFTPEDERVNPYQGNTLNNSIYHKQEFYENRLEVVEDFPKIPGEQTKYQKTIARFLSSHTPYDRLLLVHDPGTGKTCSAIGAIEQIRLEMMGQKQPTFTRAYIFAPGQDLLKNFQYELVNKCTAGEFIPDNLADLADKAQVIRTNNLVRQFYDLNTFEIFAKSLANSSDEVITESYSHTIIVIDEVHNLRQKDKEAGKLDIYFQFHRFLHLVKHCKVILMSGTPMKDTPQEIASVMNLILDNNEQLPTEKDFVDEFFDGTIIKRNKIDVLRKRFEGKISFLRESSSGVKKVFKTNPDYPLKTSLEHLVVYPLRMSAFQTKWYEQALQKQSAIFEDAQQASLFVFPNGSYGSAGFNTYIRRPQKNNVARLFTSSFQLSPEFEKVLNTGNVLENIRTYSCAYYETIKMITEGYGKGNIFVYCSVVEGGGCILLSLLLKLFGYSIAKGDETTEGKRIAVLTSETTSNNDVDRIKKLYNSEKNVMGNYIQVIIGSVKISEGHSFLNVQKEVILTPHWNYSETTQVIARGVRFGSHNMLQKLGVQPKVDIYQMVSIPDRKLSYFDKNEHASIFLRMYKISEDKDYLIRTILRIMMEEAVDCALNYNRNFVDGVKDSRDCDYTVCEFKCSGVNMNDKTIDYSTYNLYYSNPVSRDLRQKIENSLRLNQIQSVKSLLSNFKGEYSDAEVLKTINLIIKQGEISYIDYLDVYVTTPFKKLLKKVEMLFRAKFEYSYRELRAHFPESTEYELLNCLNFVISNNIKILNKFGFHAYLREANNTFFLMDNLLLKADSFSSYYDSNITISNDKSFQDIIEERLGEQVDSKFIDICKCRDYETFKELVGSLPLTYQEIVLELVLELDKQNELKRELLVEFVQEFFKSYLQNNDGNVFSLLLQGDRTYRCLPKAQNETWRDCNASELAFLSRAQTEKLERAKKESYKGIVALYNEEKDIMCLIDTDTEKKRDGDDQRLTNVGKNCTSWTVKDLLRIVDKLEIEEDVPIERGRRLTKEEMIASILRRDKNDAFTQEELAQRSERRLANLYQLVSNGGKKDLCALIKKTFLDNDKLIHDPMCGQQGRIKIIQAEKQQESKTDVNLIIIQLTTANDVDRKFYIDSERSLKEYAKDSYLGDISNIVSVNSEVNRDATWYLFRRGASKIIIAYFYVLGGEIKGFSVNKTYYKKDDIVDIIRTIGNKVESISNRILENTKMTNYQKRYNFLLKCGFVLGDKIGEMQEFIFPN